jgi:hypothetical protein
VRKLQIIVLAVNSAAAVNAIYHWEAEMWVKLACEVALTFATVYNIFKKGGKNGS